jgi:rhodanese-related sulfurtransferase
MSKRYIILAILLIGSAFGLLMIPQKTELNQVEPSSFLLEINNPARFLGTDQIAKRIIDGDPGLFLIDVRSLYEYEDYSIPGAVNIPLEELLLEQWQDFINQEDMDIVYYSNGDVYADQAWMLSAQFGNKNLYVMKGGVNSWFKTIMQPEIPDEMAASQDFDLYNFRKGASIYFGGSSQDVVFLNDEKKDSSKKKVSLKKKKKKAAEGGC